MSTNRSAYQAETEPKQVEAIKFATEIAQKLYTASNNGEFKQLYLIADPSFLGLLRQHINPQIQKHVIAEIAKELTSSKKEVIEQHLAEL
jgi:protein required for attachment to host cells